MGLDQYAWTIKADLIGDQQVDFDMGSIFPDKEIDGKTDYGTDRAEREGVLDTNFAYWRKFNNLHGWMERLYRKKGGKAESFNCEYVRLMPEDLSALVKDSNTLDPTPGFFFGSMDEMTPEDVAEVLTFVANALAAIASGYAVIYSSWW